MKTKSKASVKGPFEVAKEGSISVPIYATTNRIYRRDPVTGQRELKSEHPQYTVIYYEGRRRVKRKFADLNKARQEADLAVIKLANGEAEVLKLTGTDRADYVHATRHLHEWDASAHLVLTIIDYVAAKKRLPKDVSLKECVDFFLKRHPVGLPQKTVREIVDDLIETKTKAGKSEIYTKELRRRLGKFADTFHEHRLSTISGKQVEDYIRGLGGAGRTQNNVRQLINTLFKFAIKRGYLPKDHDEMSSVERASADSGEIEVFTPAELRKLFAACETPVLERKKWRTREDMIPYLAIAAFCGLRAAEIQRLDWSQVILTGPERFVEVKAANAKTGSRRTVPIPDNCAAWLARYAKPTGPVAQFERTDKQLFIYLAGKSGVPWKHNGLRHSYISYRVAETKNVHQTSLEAGNSPQMIFQHYRQLVTETAAKDWFSIVPAKKDGADIIPMPPTPTKAETADTASAETAPAARTRK